MSSSSCGQEWGTSVSGGARLLTSEPSQTYLQIRPDLDRPRVATILEVRPELLQSVYVVCASRAAKSKTYVPKTNCRAYTYNTRQIIQPQMKTQYLPTPRRHTVRVVFERLLLKVLKDVGTELLLQPVAVVAEKALEPVPTGKIMT